MECLSTQSRYKAARSMQRQSDVMAQFEKLIRTHPESKLSIPHTGELAGPFESIERDLGPAIAAVRALYESTFKDACVMDWTQELIARLQVINLATKGEAVVEAPACCCVNRAGGHSGCRQR